MMQNNFLYWLYDYKTGLVKIGETMYPAKRRREIELDVMRPLTIVGLFLSGINTYADKRFHDAVKEKRVTYKQVDFPYKDAKKAWSKIRVGKEWYDLSETPESWLKACIKAGVYKSDELNLILQQPSRVL